MFNFIHRRTCQHPEVHLLRPPPMLDQLLGAEIEVALRRWHRRRQARVEEELRELSALTPGPKDVITGLPWPPVSLAYDPTQLVMAINTWGCSRYGQVMVIATPGSLTPTIVRLQLGS